MKIDRTSIIERLRQIPEETLASMLADILESTRHVNDADEMLATAANVRDMQFSTQLSNRNFLTAIRIHEEALNNLDVACKGLAKHCRDFALLFT